MVDFSTIPSVDRLLDEKDVRELSAIYSRDLTVEAIRTVLDEVRSEALNGHALPNKTEIVIRIQRVLESWTEATLYPVINASGVIIHTNLGRAPLSEEAMRAASDVATRYSNLEFNMHSGKRGSRLLHAEELLTRITGAEAALVVNNNAAAVLLVLTALSRRRRVLIARSQLVEIGGGFRIPDVMKQSGAVLVEIGTTNRIHLADYQKAIEEQPIYLVMRAHRSNFAIIGFTAEPSLADISKVAHQAEIPVVDDLGSGSLLDTSRYGLAHEPTVQESLEEGADLVCFSGDKLLGGPQAGIIVGRRELIAKLKKHPLARAIRADKLALAALSATLLHYLKNEAEEKVPVWQMITAGLDEIQNRAESWRDTLGQGEIIDGESTVGGGSLPGETLPTRLLALDIPSADRFLGQLRSEEYPVIARVQNDRVLFDPRTVLPQQEKQFLETVQSTLNKS